MELERGELYSAYAQYCAANASPKMSRQELYDRIRSTGKVSERRRGTMRYFIGVAIASDSRQEYASFGTG
ncbi:hypothetical protein ACFL6S_25660 [Candidatus Poribacteria bacterium]